MGLFSIIVHFIWAHRYFLILLSSIARYSQEPWLKRIFEILWVLFEKIPVFYFYRPKSWILRTLGHVRNIFLNFIFIMLQRKSFGQKKFWIPRTGSKLSFCQNWKIAKLALLNPCMEFKKSHEWVINMGQDGFDVDVRYRINEFGIYLHFY